MKGSTIVAIAAGCAAGVVAGMLLAPRSGAQTRALLVDQADELWGQGQDFFEKNVKDLGSRAYTTVPSTPATGDELREKIEAARARIAEQVARNATETFENIAANAPEAAEEVVEAVQETAAEAAEAVEEAAEAAKEAVEEAAPQE